MCLCLRELPPVLPAHANSWLQDVWARLPYYARHRVEERASGSGDQGGDGRSAKTRVLTGVEALEAMWPSVQKRPAAKLPLEDLDLFVALKFLMTKTMQAEVDKVKGEVLKHHRSTAKQRGSARQSVAETEAGNAAKKRRVSAAKAAAKAASDSLFSLGLVLKTEKPQIC